MLKSLGYVSWKGVKKNKLDLSEGRQDNQTGFSSARRSTNGSKRRGSARGLNNMEYSREDALLKMET